MEQAEHALFRSLGLSVFPQRNVSNTNISDSGSGTSGTLSAASTGAASSKERLAALDGHADELNSSLHVTWPRVHISLDFLGPARFEEILRIEVVVAKLGDSSVTFQHAIYGPKQPVARGTSISVCCRIDRSNSHELIKQPIPQTIRDKLKTFLRTQTQQ